MVSSWARSRPAAKRTKSGWGTQLSIEQPQLIWDGKDVPGTDADDVGELLNYRGAFDLVSEYLASGAPITEGLIRDPSAPGQVREQGMDLTGWLDYFVDGPSVQLREVKARGEQAIRADLVAREHKLHERQALLLDAFMREKRLTLQAVSLCSLGRAGGRRCSGIYAGWSKRV